MSSIKNAHTPWLVRATRPLVNRPPWLTVWEEHVALPNGMEIADYVRCIGRDYAVIFALTDDGVAPMVSQYKHGMGAVSLDLPAGYLDAGESPLAAAQRELLEETGLAADEWRSLGQFVVDTNRGDTAAHLFFARGARPAGPQALDESEEITVTYHTPGDLMQKLSAGEIRSLATATGILWGARLAQQHD
jgi:ADP-ribose pyrophosphatase